MIAITILNRCMRKIICGRLYAGDLTVSGQRQWDGPSEIEPRELGFDPALLWIDVRKTLRGTWIGRFLPAEV